MANFEIPENPEYSEEVRKFEEEDPGHADLFNAVVETLLNNEVFLKKLADSLAKRISGLDTLTKYTTVQTPNPSIGAQIVQKESETFDLDGNTLPFPIQEVVEGHEAALRQLNTDLSANTAKEIVNLKGGKTITFECDGYVYIGVNNSGHYCVVDLFDSAGKEIFSVKQTVPGRQSVFVRAGMKASANYDVISEVGCGFIGLD